MKTSSKFLIGLIGICVVAISLWSGYTIFTPYLVGPKLGVQLTCSAIQEGTTAEALEDRFGGFTPFTDTQNALVEAILSDAEKNGSTPPRSNGEINQTILKIYDDLDYYSYLDLGYDPSLEPYLDELLAQNNNRLPDDYLTAISRRLNELDGITTQTAIPNNGPAQIYSNFKSGWLCICEVEMENGRVDRTNFISCSQQ